MNMRKSLPWPMKLFSIFGLIVLLSSSVSGSNASVAYAQDPTPPAPNGDVQPLAANGSSLYYYVDGQRVNLTPSLDWVSVKFVSADTVEQQSVTGTFSSTVAPLDGAREIPHLGLTLLPLQDGLGTKTLVQGVNSMRASSSSFSQVNPVYSYDGVDMVVSDEFIAAFPLEAGMEDIDALNAARGVEMVSPILGQENTFVLRVTSAASLDALAMANHYQESGIALFAAPNFVRIAPAGVETATEAPASVGPMFTPNDSFYVSDQWYLNSTGQWGATVDADIDAPEAWNITKGDTSIIIAVIDEGVDLTHEDLVTNLVTGYDATGLGSNGAQAPLSDDAHGTAVAGIAAAVSNNNQGVSGVCQLCRIMPIRIAYSDSFGDWVYTDAWAADGIAWAIDPLHSGGADILNNSWGGGLGATVVNTAITNAVTNGRGGTGSVVLAAAGNDNENNVSWPASLSNVISVGALNLCDQRKNLLDYQTCVATPNENWGSNYGTALDVMAAGVYLTTTDIMGPDGYSDGTGNEQDYGENYTGYMNGTSGATPIVSGVVGLMLSVNTNMTPAHVQEILQRTTDNIGAAGWDEETGYGRVNAFNAVTKAKMADLVITSYQLTSDAAGLVPIINPAVNQTFYIKIFVKNRGGTDAPAFYRSVYYEDHFSQLSVAPPASPDFLEGCLAGTAPLVGDYYPPSLFGGITAGSSDNGLVVVEVDGGLGVGSHQLRLYADPLCLVDEAVEDLDNNDFGPITVNVGTYVDVSIAAVNRGSYLLTSGLAMRKNYPTVDAGPVVVESNDGTDIIAALRDAYYVGGQLESFVQLMGLPRESLSTSYYFPAYNNVTLDGQLRFGNVGNSATTVTVTIAGVVRGTYPLNPGEAKRVNYAGLNSGPVVVSSSGGVPIIAALRDAYYVDGRLESFAQLMGLPAEKLSTKYYFPAYNNVTMDGQLRIGNVGNASTTVTVTIAGVVRGTYPLSPSQAVRINYAGLDSGPVEVSSSGGVPIIAALRDAYYVDAKLVSFVQLMGLPQEQLSTNYNFPAYNNVTLDGQLRFGNVGNSATTVTVTIGGVVRGTYSLNPSESKRVNYAGLDSGPVTVSSSGAVPIIAALRDAYFVNGKVESFAQLMGLPFEFLSTGYYFPAYNNVTLDGQLRFGIP